MGGIISRWRKKQTTEEILDSLQGKIKAIEESKKTNIEKQRRLIGSLILYSVLGYILAALLFYFYYMPESWPDRLLYSSPMAVFPVLVWLTKRFLRWYFVKRISKNETALEELKEKRKTILEEVMDKETYKRAKEILEKYDPERFKTLEGPVTSTPIQRTPEGQELRHRQGLRPVAQTPGATPGPRGPVGRGGPMATPSGPHPLATPRAPGTIVTPIQKNGTNQMGFVPRGPPMPRPVLPRERTVMDKLVEYLVGDGPQNRYALICKDCSSHNGMALKEEFEFISFRCCYCFTVNPARKKRPFAPKLEPATPKPVPQEPDPSPEAESEESMETEEQGEGHGDEGEGHGDDVHDVPESEVTDSKKDK